MIKVEVSASTRYDVLIGENLRNSVGSLIKELFCNKTVAIITDDIVDKLYASEVEKSLTDEGFKTVKFVLENGESNKTAENWLSIISFLADSKLSRDDIVLALGGGVVGDMAGFAAATYMRGINLIQVPTTLLAQVDSSVGGKTAVDLKEGKNLLGAFYQPKMVICDTKTLNTLSDELFADGMAEVIKAGIIGDKSLFEMVQEGDCHENIDEIISLAVKFKADIVKEDETEFGVRMKLNLGHTLGHTYEKLSNYEISHGSAVAIGIAEMAKISNKAGFCEREAVEEILACLLANKLSTDCNFSSKQVCAETTYDKKRRQNSISFITIHGIGDCRITKIETDKTLEFVSLSEKY